MRRRVFLMLLAGLVFSAANSGCAQLAEMRRYLTMNDRNDNTEEYSDDWSAVGREGRGDQPKELETDAWFDKLFHSEKYREINRNLGYRYE